MDARFLTSDVDLNRQELSSGATGMPDSEQAGALRSVLLLMAWVLTYRGRRRRGQLGPLCKNQ